MSGLQKTIATPNAGRDPGANPCLSWQSKSVMLNLRAGEITNEEIFIFFFCFHNSQLISCNKIKYLFLCRKIKYTFAININAAGAIPAISSAR